MPQPSERLAWVDYAKGLCIILVVMMHSTLGYEAAAHQEGWLHAVVSFAKPFRIPAFFMMSGLLLAHAIDRDWRTYFDQKVLHYVYLYVLWLTIQFAFKAPGIVAEQGARGALSEYALAFVEPFGTLWFIYLLPIFFVAAKLLRHAPPLAVWFAAAALNVAAIETHWTVIDEFANRFVFFYTGYIAVQAILGFAERAGSKPVSALAGIALFGGVDALLVYRGFDSAFLMPLVLGMTGAAALIAVSVLMAKVQMPGVFAYCGRNSAAIYLAFFLPMAASRVLLLKTGWIPDIGTDSALVTLCAIGGALALHWAVRGTRLRYLYERPDALKLSKPLRLAPQS